ncbi:unnamed protein product, partial [Amoebophrya sp. A120]
REKQQRSRQNNGGEVEITPRSPLQHSSAISYAWSSPKLAALLLAYGADFIRVVQLQAPCSDDFAAVSKDCSTAVSGEQEQDKTCDHADLLGRAEQ